MKLLRPRVAYASIAAALFVASAAGVSAKSPTDADDLKDLSCGATGQDHSGPGHFRFNTSACENGAITKAVLPLHRGTSHGKTVWYVIMDSSNQKDAEQLHVNYAPKLVNAKGTAAVQKVKETDGSVDFPFTVDFSPQRVLVPGPDGFPPANGSQPGARGELSADQKSGYTPLIQLPGGIVRNAPQIANDSGQADKVVSLDKDDATVVYRETEGRYEDKHVHYASFDASDPVAAALEDVTYAPALNTAPSAGDEGRMTSAREELIAFTNGPIGAANPQRQGLNSAILDHLDPHNLLHETPVLPLHADVGSHDYAPLWDIHLAEWTPKAIAAGDRVELRSVDEVNQRIAAGLVTGFNGSQFGPAGFIVNCPLISIDVP